MSEYPMLSEGILGEEDIPKTNTELFLDIVGQYFPEAIKDGEVDFTALKEEMGEFAEVGPEHYNFTWAGKQAAKKEAQADLYGKTLRFKPQDSVNADTTENIYIEGDNLEALKLLRRNYHGQIKMIYIDPPYNTGNDFVYRDNFTMTDEELADLSGDTVDGVRYQKNPKDSAKYHTYWLNMMYPRLKLARELLSDDGVVFISIDDNEQGNLKKLCDEIFGADNFVCLLCVKMSHLSGMKMSHKDKKIPKIKEFIYMYIKDISKININPVYIPGEWDSVLDRYNGYIDNFEQDISLWKRTTLSSKIVGLSDDEALKFKIENAHRIFRTAVNDSFANTPKDGVFRKEISKTGLEKIVYNAEEVLFASTKLQIFDGKMLPADTIGDIWLDIGINNLHNEGGVPFPNGKKPYKLIKRLLQMSTESDSIVLDFFSGSATTAHAVMQFNAEVGGKRKFIMVQLPEETAENSEAAKAGYKNICEIGKERIRRAAKKIHEDNPDAVFDDGFKVFEVGGTTIRWNTADDEEIQSLLDLNYTDDEKDRLDFAAGFNDTDVVYEVMLRQYGIPLSTPIETRTDVSDRTYMFADAVVVCLDTEITDELVEKLAAIEPTPAKFVLRDSAFGDNIALKDESFRTLSALIRSHQSEDERKSKYNNYTVEFI